MQKLGLNENDSQPTKNFWRRQFQTEATATQRRFDWIFGIFLPVLCFFYDPLIFRSSMLGPAYLGNYKPFAYILSFVSIMAMAAWLIWGAKLKWLNAFLAGLFAVGAIVSIAVGVVLLPMSFIGLFLLIGALGFTPFFSALVYLRNASRAYRSAEPFLEKRVLVSSLVLSAIFSAVIPAVTNARIMKAVDEMCKGDVQTMRERANALRYIAPLVDFDDLAVRYERVRTTERENEEMKAVAETYRMLTGEDIERKLQSLRD
jgi:hypothetical protein